MSEPSTSEPLLAEFPEHSYEQWHAAAEALLKGAPFEKLLVSGTYEEITIQPIYRREDITGLEHRRHLPGADSLVRGSRPAGFLKTGWEVSQELHASTPEEFNRIAFEGLQGGQSELNICGEPAIRDLADMKIAFHGINIDAISTFWQSGDSCLPLAAIYFASAIEAGLDQQSLRACFDNDPLADLATDGGLNQDLARRFDQAAALTGYARKNAPQVRTLTVQGDLYHNAGATATQELAYIISTLVCYLEEMKARGLSPHEVLPHVRIRLAVGSDYFMEIAKIRATRWLWSKVASAYGVENAPVHIHASTSRWNKTTYDAHTNMLRVTAEAFAAVVAGVDSLHVGPFDEVAGHSDEFSRRIARNVHVILREECGLDHVIDPAGGSTYIEWLTDRIAAKSWAIFQDIESRGGMLDCLKDGSVQKEVEAVCQAKFQNIRRRKDKIVGANMYPNLKGAKLGPKARTDTEKPPSSPGNAGHFGSFQNPDLVEQAISAALAGASATQISAALGSGPCDLRIPTLKPRRAAEEYEALRDASTAFAARTGSPPAILQLNIGPSARYRLRADWTASFFEAAGFAVDGARDFAGHDDALAALEASKAGIAVITSDDGTYQEFVIPFAVSAKSSRPGVTLLVAVAPGENEAAWRAAGIDHFVNVRSNNYELNAKLLELAGVL